MSLHYTVVLNVDGGLVQYLVTGTRSPQLSEIVSQGSTMLYGIPEKLKRTKIRFKDAGAIRHDGIVQRSTFQLEEEG